MFCKALNKYHYFLHSSILAILLVSSALAGGGFPDKGFADKGKLIPQLSNATEKAYDVAVQADGKIVVVGTILATGTGVGYDFFIGRYNPDGSVDTNFGNNGQKILSLGAPSDSESATSVVIQSDGKIVVSGSAQVPATVTEFAVVRLFPSGEMDPTFGTGGIKKIAVTPTGGSGAMGMALQIINGQEKIVLAGYGFGQSQPVMALARLDMAGNLDQSFGSGGVKLVPSTSPMEYAYDVAIQNVAGENKIVAGGFSRFSMGGGSFRDDFAVVRLNTDGSMDNTFGTEGKVRTQMSGTAAARGVVIQQMGPNQARIVAGGYAFRGTGNDFAVAAYTLTGGLDPTFGDATARAYVDMAGREDQMQELLVQPDGKLIGVGWTRNGTTGNNQDYAVARLNADGSLDKSYGGCGKTVTDLGSNTDIAYGGVLQPDGKVIAVGEYGPNTSTADVSVARYSVTGGGASAVSSDYDGDSRDDISVFRPSNGTWYVNCSCEGTARTVQFGAAGDIPVGGDYDGDGYTDQAVFRNGIWYVNRSSDGTVTVAQFGAEEDVPTIGDYDGDGLADVSVWRASTGVWYVIRSSNGEYDVKNFGVEGDKPVQADYDQDGKTDLAVYRAGTWWIVHSSEPGGNYYAYQFGNASDTPVKGDFDGDKKADLVVYRAAEGLWYQQLSRDGFKTVRFGAASDLPVPADYTGDGKTDPAVFRNGTWYVQTAPNGAYSVTNFGLTGDVPAVLK